MQHKENEMKVFMLCKRLLFRSFFYLSWRWCMCTVERGRGRRNKSEHIITLCGITLCILHVVCNRFRLCFSQLKRQCSNKIRCRIIILCHHADIFPMEWFAWRRCRQTSNMDFHKASPVIKMLYSQKIIAQASAHSYETRNKVQREASISKHVGVFSIRYRKRTVRWKEGTF